MIDVDFLPTWYLELQRRQWCAKKQYLVLGVIFLVMILWNSFATRRISLVSAEISLKEPEHVHAQYLLEEVEQIKRQLGYVEERRALANQLDSNLEMSILMAEISQLVNSGLRFTQLQFQAESYSDPSDALRVSDGNSTSEVFGPTASVAALEVKRFQVLIQAEATDTQPIATFLSDLEESTYFRHVHLMFTRQRDSVESNQKVTEDADDNLQGAGGLYPTECKIRCTVANYVEP